MIKAIKLIFKERIIKTIPLMILYSLFIIFPLFLLNPDLFTFINSILYSLLVIINLITLRILDDVSDLEYDRRYNPERVIARGDVSVKQCFILTIFLFILPLIPMFLIYRFRGFITLVPKLYILLIYKNFYIKNETRIVPILKTLIVPLEYTVFLIINKIYFHRGNIFAMIIIYLTLLTYSFYKDIKGRKNESIPDNT